MGDKVKLEVEHLEDFSFLLDDILCRDRKVSDLFSNYLRMERVNILVFGSHVKNSDSKGMNILVL